jgi:hypothetical protein
VKTIKRRRVEIIAFERERIVRQPGFVHCPICGISTEMLTTRQAARLTQTRPQSIRRWLARGQAHGLRTVGGAHRVCRDSLFLAPELTSFDLPDREHDLEGTEQTLALERVFPLPPKPARC